MNYHKIIPADFVESEGGTGIVHIAPAYGEDDFVVAEKHNIAVKDVLDDEGYYLPETNDQLEQLFRTAFGENYEEILKKAEVKTSDDGRYECWSANKMLAKALEKVREVWKIEMIRHEYPFNPRSKQRIMYRAFPSWFMDIDKPTLLAQNENINWFPPHIKHGRFAKNIEAAPDWNLSRDRFWATAMPVWKGDRGSVRVVGSYDELEELSGVRLTDYHRPWVDGVEFDLPVKKLIKSFIMGVENADEDLRNLGIEFTRTHGDLGTYYSAILPENRLDDFEKFIIEKIKPDFFNEYIVEGRGVFLFKLKDGKVERYVWSENERDDEKRIGELVAEMTGSFNGSIRKMWEENDFYGKDICEKSGETEHFTRIDKVLDGWFESGSMPFAQFHYPFENKTKFEQNYPADFIVEYVAQVRAWFYYIHVINTALAECGAFGELKDEEGK